MTRRTRNPDQLDLFVESPDVVVKTPPRQGVTSGYGGIADRMLPVLDQVADGRYGAIETTSCPVELIEDRGCRITDVEDVLELLARQGYIREAGATVARHGAVWKGINVYRITTTGHRLRARWSHLAGVTPRQSGEEETP